MIGLFGSILLEKDKKKAEGGKAPLFFRVCSSNMHLPDIIVFFTSVLEKPCFPFVVNLNILLRVFAQKVASDCNC